MLQMTEKLPDNLEEALEFIKEQQAEISHFDLSIQVQQLFQKFFNDLSRRTETQTFSWTVIDKFNNLGKLIAGNIFK